MTISLTSTASAGDNSSFPRLVTPCPPFMFSAAQGLTANSVRGSRVVIPRSGTLKDVQVLIASFTSAANVLGAVYDTNDALAGSRTLLWQSSGNVAVASTGWKALGDPNIAVTQGQQFDFGVIGDTATFGYGRSTTFPIDAFSQLPTSFVPAPGGALAKLGWFFNNGSFAFPATITEANCSPWAGAIAVIGRIV